MVGRPWADRRFHYAAPKPPPGDTSKISPMSSSPRTMLRILPHQKYLIDQKQRIHEIIGEMMHGAQRRRKR